MPKISKLKIDDISENLKNKFSIPRSYQRGYRWRTEYEVFKLLNDINSSEDNNGYSLQPLIICPSREVDGKYNVIDGQQRLTTILLIIDDNPDFSDFHHDEIDKWYIEKAKTEIECFFEKNNKEIFLEKLNKAFFIRYEVDENDEDEARRIFFRINEGKIPLSSAELLKAWIFTSTEDIYLRECWKEMEEGLMEDEFFYFINPDADSPRYYATRLDYIAELIEIELIGKTKKQIEVESKWENDHTYVFNSLIEGEKTQGEIFSKMYSLYKTLRNCYDDINVYNRLGYILHCFLNNDQYEVLTELENQTLNLFNYIPKQERRSDFRYGEDNKDIMNQLLLYNLSFYNSKDRFNFKYFSEVKNKRKWSLDHIHAKNAELLADSQLKQLENTLISQNKIDDVDCINLKNRFSENSDVKAYQDILYDLLYGACKYDKNTHNIQIIEHKDSISKWIHGIGNLVLLERDMNASFNNISFSKKQEKANNVSKHLLDGTSYAYKISKSGNWLKDEYDSYENDIKTKVDSFLSKCFKIDCYTESYRLSDNKPCYGNVPVLPFKNNNNALSLKNILEKTAIVIPDFQREYAQGRTDVQSIYVRKKFLDEIFRFLNGSDNHLDLDFIYGSVTDKNELFPFDGQQRLTTVFLVYCCLYFKAEQKCEDYLKKFTYANRDEAAKYCKEIVSGRMICMSESKNASVKGMNITVNEILQRIDNSLKKDKIHQYIERMENIRFFIPNDISLTPDIYWRMNARGKTLTPLEKFKSFFFSKDEKEFSEKYDKVAERFFLYYKNHSQNNEMSQSYEEAFQNLISLMFDSFQKISKSKEEPEVDFFKPELLSTSLYVEYKKKKSELNVLKSLIDVLADSDLKLIEEEYKSLCPKYTKQKNNNNLFIWTDKQGKEKTHALMFSYLITLANGKQNRQWMRVCANLIWNSSDVASALKLIFNELLANASDILSFLAKDENENLSNISQYEEEHKKAKAIIKDKKVSIEQVEEAESTAFADGRIDFLFYNAKDICWNNFITKRENFARWFDEKGINSDYSDAIVTAYVKLSPWDWYELYFNTSREHWKNRIFRGIHDRVYNADYRKIVDGLLSAKNLCSIVFKKSESQRSDIIRKSLIDSNWFIKWMMSEHSDFKIVWYSWNLHNEIPVFTRIKSGQKIYIYWDADGWKYDNKKQNNQITKFFKVMKEIIHPDGDYFRVIDYKGDDITNYNDSKKNITDLSKVSFDENQNHLVVWGYYIDFCYVKFTYQGKVLYMTTPGVIITEEEYYVYQKEDIIDILENEKKYETRCIYQNSQNMVLKNKEDLKKLLDDIIEGIL